MTNKQKKKEKEEEINFDKEYNYMQQFFINKSIGMNLKEIIEKIQFDKDFIFNIIKYPKVEEISKNIVNMYKFNKDEAKDIVQFAITEFFYQDNVNLENFNEDNFLFYLNAFIKTTVRKHIRQGYSGKEYPSSDWSEYINLVNDKFDDDKIIERIDLENAINNLSKRDQEIFKLYYVDRNTLQQIANMLNLSKTHVHNILGRSNNKIKNILKF